MTDAPTPLSDEDLSAALDGDAPPELVARIDADPAARARLAELRTAADLIGAPVDPLPAASVDALLARALAAAADDDELDGREDDTGIDADSVVPLPRRRLPPTWLVAAVIVVLVAAGVGLVWSGTHSGTSQDRASSVNKAQTPTADASTSGAASGAGSGAAPSAAPDSGFDTEASAGAPPPAGVVGLGDFPDADSLREALAKAFPVLSSAAPTTVPASGDAKTGSQDAAGTTTRSSATPAPTAQAVDRCATQAKATLSLPEGPTHQGFGTVDGKPVLVYEFASTSFKTGKPTTLVVAVGRDACDPVVTFER